ncbi:BZIP domain class transcription factor isoform 1 [Hibiscus syriacus]|uniref:BZIP domain class transcription factor isoform 1 n=1 Tax=Hibiscus syriacus TaxID=106335 RepID=A0A6A2Y405_HIBSY|nr:BZIP domain class transcription factor isoform 1 [Hibiscus syriacus]
MALRCMLGWSDGELMRSDAKPCSRLMRQTAGIFTVGGALGFWVLCRLHYVIQALEILFREVFGGLPCGAVCQLNICFVGSAIQP